MIPPRYPAPSATREFSQERKIERWTAISIEYMLLAAREAPIGISDADRSVLRSYPGAFPPILPEEVSDVEASTGHDVVAFLTVLTGRLRVGLRPLLHYGLTSSDLVDNAHFSAMRSHAAYVAGQIARLQMELRRWEEVTTVRAGRTHGQVADLTSWNHQMLVVDDVLRNLRRGLLDYEALSIVKSPGPTGKSSLRHRSAGIMALEVKSTQVIPRDYQVQWAALYLRLAGALENLAMIVRLGARAEVAEVGEGGSRVGSSSMPHKRNPVESEKVCGLARVVRGYFATIAESATLWEERDISNSSVERIVVPDLAAVVEYMLDTMTKVMDGLWVDHARMHFNAYDPRTASAIYQSTAQVHFRVGPVEASSVVRSFVDFGNREAGKPVVQTSRIATYFHTSEDLVDAWEADALSHWETLLG